MRIVFVAAAATAYTSAEPACSSFGAWRVAHGKNYASAAAGTAAERTFAANCGRYAALNALPGGARFGADEWSDLSPGAFAARFGGGLDAAALARGDAAPPVAPAPLAMPPSGGGGDRNRYVIDWREHGQVTPVKDQGKYGTCWSFGVAQNLEGLGVRQGHTLANVSEQAFISCCPACQGAAATASFSWLVNASGSRGAPALEATYPYAGPVENCTFASAPKAPVRLVSWGRVQDDGTGAPIAAALMSSGPMGMGVDATCFAGYKGGVIRACDNSKGIDHAVLMVGAGVDAGVKYFTIKNSWGGTWGEGGYVRIEQGQSWWGNISTVFTQ